MPKGKDDLLDALDKGQRPNVRRAIFTAGRALEAAHAERIIHRDVKPENILLTDDGSYLIDWDYARYLGNRATPRGAAGTPQYMSPEALYAMEDDPHFKYDGFSSDVYSLAKTYLKPAQGKNSSPGLSYKDTRDVLERFFSERELPTQLLELGYVVRGTVRTPKPWLKEYFDQKYSPDAFEPMLVESFEDREALERALDGVQGLVHLTSDLSFGSDPNVVIPWVVQATLAILEAAAQRPAIKHGHRIDGNTWNDAAVRDAWDENTPEEHKGLAVYSASKIEGERQSWKWIETHRSQFTFNTVLPSFTVGRILHPEIFGSTMGWVRQLLKGDSTTFGRFHEQWYVDVEDVTRLFVIGLLDPEVKSERIFAFADQSTWTDTVARLRQLRPGNTRISSPSPNGVRDRGDVPPRERAQSLLRGFYGQAGFASVREALAKDIEGWG
ncbi:hypothetical protein NUU61_008617 [Penicillium alfredii]|uniref:Protein kinase domain-containing protein n=1 Tax=Penicillium alfredii TaxID=1506179 RepID=A0A9W9ELH8_9EURO|nr:uncharacterized protein NUU61_008617 [Penicillium alfredii]KAJ5084038.1 hypothetical protein NUU61_008617 [Penicillium alfredii]